MAKVVMLVNSYFTGSKSGKPLRLEKGQTVEEDEVKNLVKGEDYEAESKAVESEAKSKKK